MTSIVAESTSLSEPRLSLSKAGMIACVVLALGIVGLLGGRFLTLTPEDDTLRDSTLGQLALWMADQTGEDEIVSPLALYAEHWAQSIDEDTLDPAILLVTMRNTLVVWIIVMALCAVAGLLLVFVQPQRSVLPLVISLVGLDLLLFTLTAPDLVGWVLLGIVALLIGLVMGPAKTSRIVGFIVAMSVLFVFWEADKRFAASTNYEITVAQPPWTYTAYPSIADSLDALAAGDVSAVVLDRRDLADNMAPFPADEDIDPARTTYPQLRYLDTQDRSMTLGPFVIEPAFSGRLAVAVQADHTAEWPSVSPLEIGHDRHRQRANTPRRAIWPRAGIWCCLISKS